MEDSESTPPADVIVLSPEKNDNSEPISSKIAKKDNPEPISSKIAEFTESKSQLLSRIQLLKEDLTNWRSTLDTQVTSYRNELSGLKKTLKFEVDEIQSQLKELKTTLQKQQEDVAASLKDLGLQDCSADVKETENVKVEEDNEDVQASPVEDIGNKSEN